MNILRGYNAEASIKIIGCDAAPTNTGSYSGALHLVELMINRCITWAVRMIHMNELPFKKLFKSIDGSTAVDKEFKGPLGKVLVQNRFAPVLTFEKVLGKVTELPEQVFNELS